MKSKFLKLNKACSEQWDNMKPNEKGSFCDVCAKNVIDFTQLSQVEISEKVKKSKGEICARLTKTQLETPLIDLEIQKTYKLPYSNIAASVLLASTLAIGNTAYAQNAKVSTEIVQNTELPSKSKINRTQSKPTTTPNRFVTFKGKIKDQENGNPIAGAKIMFVTVHKMLSTKTLKDGTFSMEIPSEFIDDDNVIRVSYGGISPKRKEKRPLTIYESADYILSKKEITSNYEIKAEQEVIYLGGIGHYSENINPVVLYKGKQISYKEFKKGARGEKSSCSLENKHYYYFSSNSAIAIYGEEAKDGLYILIDSTTK